MGSVTKCNNSSVVAKGELAKDRLAKDLLAKIGKLVKDVGFVAQSKIGGDAKNIVLFGNKKEVERSIITAISGLCLYKYSYSQLELVEQASCKSLLERGVCKQIENIWGGMLWICKEFIDEWDDKIRNAIYLYKLIKERVELKVVLVLSESELDFANCATMKNVFDRISKIFNSPEKVFKNMHIVITQAPTCYERSSVIEKLISLEKKLLGKNCIDCENVTIVETGNRAILYALGGQGVIDLHPKVALDGIAHVHEVVSHCMIVAEGYHLKLYEIILTNISSMTVSELDDFSKNISSYNTLEKFKPLIRNQSRPLYKKLLTELESVSAVADFFKDVKHLEDMVVQIKKMTLDLEHLRELVQFGYQARKSSNPAELQKIQNGVLQKFVISRLNKLKKLIDSVRSNLKTGAIFATLGFSALVGGVVGMPVGVVMTLKATFENSRDGLLGLFDKCLGVAVCVPYGVAKGALFGAGAGFTFSAFMITELRKHFKF